MTTLTEGRHAGEFILSEANGSRSRENVTVASGQDLAAGAVLGKITSGGKYAAYDNGASDGTEVAAAILLDACDATGGDVAAAVIARDAEVNGECLGYLTGADEAAGIADLLAVGIIVR
jgi:hypothetical protein